MNFEILAFILYFILMLGIGVVFFFKSKDADALTAAFQEYSGKVVKKQEKEKPSIRKQLVKLQEAVKEMAKSLSRNKHQEVDR